MISDERYLIREYTPLNLESLLTFFKECLPESGRELDLDGRHASLLHIEDNYDYFICLIEVETGRIIGTCALKKMSELECELKCVYLYKKYHRQGLGTKMSQIIIDMARQKGFKEMYLDTISKSSERAIKMYERLGFERVEKYHEAVYSDVFMKLNL